MRKPLGLRTEILTTLTVLVGAALLLGGGLFQRLTEQELLEQRVVQQQALVTSLGNSLVNQLSSIEPSRSPSVAAQTLKSLPAELQVRNWSVYDRNFRSLASFRSDAIPFFDETSLRRIKLSNEIRTEVQFPSLLNLFADTEAFQKIAVPIKQNGAFWGCLEMHFSLEDIRYRTLKQQQMILIYVLVYGVVLVAIGYYLLQRNIVRPARELLHATDEVSRGELKTRLPVVGPQEIVQLANSYNNMVEALQKSRQETQQNIDALHESNRQLQSARDEVIRNEKLASVGQLAAGLAHELGNPLAALMGYLDVLGKRVQDRDCLDITGRAAAESARIDFLVRELLDFSRPSETHVEDCDLEEESQRAITLLRSQGLFQQRKVTVHAEENLPLVLLDKQKFQQVLVNLLLNGLQATNEDGQIQIEIVCDEKDVSLVVADDGQGISKEHLERIFDPFFTTKEPGEGTGLGLAICHRLMQESGGEIHVTSEPGQGSRFSLAWPLSVKSCAKNA